ncbi:MAG: thioredoxin family protein [Trueperaceae bacterium]
MVIKVLGTGCPKCKRLQAEAEKALADTGIEARIEKVEDIDGIMRYGVMVTPALVIDEEVKSSGRIPQAAEIAGWLTAAGSGSGVAS